MILPKRVWSPISTRLGLKRGLSFVSPLGMVVGARMVCCTLESVIKNRLEDGCEFPFHNFDMLQDPSKWPVKHAVRQVSSQEAGTVFREKYADRDKAAGESRFIVLINKREKNLCQNVYRAQSAVDAFFYCPCFFVC